MLIKEAEKNRHLIPDINSISLEEKGRLFDALFSCDRMRIMGYARGGDRGVEGKISHVGIEIWKKYPMTDEQFKLYDEREVFLEFIGGLLEDIENDSQEKMVRHDLERGEA